MDPAQTPPPTTPPPLQPQLPDFVPLTPAGIAPTEISIDEAKKLEHGGQKKKKKKIILGIIGALILFVVFAIFLIMLGSSQKKPDAAPVPTPTEIPKPAASILLPIEKAKNPQALVSYVPHFFDFKPDDIVNVSDIRGVFNYKDNLIVVSFAGIVEFNPKTSEFVRQNDPRVLKCINYATVIENMLYVACNGWDTYPDGKNKGVYVINLDSGKIEKIYKEGTFSFANVFVASSDTTLWVGNRSSVVKVDPKTDNMEEYTPEMLGLSTCKDFRVYAYGSAVWVTCISSATSSISVYDAPSNTWKAFAPQTPTNSQLYTLGYNTDFLYFLTEPSSQKLYTYDVAAKSLKESDAGTLRIPSSKPEAAEMRALLQKDVIFKGIGQPSIAFLPYFDTKEKQVKDFELIISPYIGVTDIVNEKRYLFTKNSIDTLKNKQFANFLVRLNANLLSGTKVFVDPSEKYAVLIGPTTPIEGANPPFSAQLVTIKSGQVTDLLIGKDPPLKGVPPEILETFAAKIKDYTLVGTSKDAQLSDPVSGETIIEIDFEDKDMSFNKSAFKE